MSRTISSGTNKDSQGNLKELRNSQVPLFHFINASLSSKFFLFFIIKKSVIFLTRYLNARLKQKSNKK